MGCGDVRLLRTIGGVDFTRQERATLNKLTVTNEVYTVGYSGTGALPRPITARGGLTYEPGLHLNLVAELSEGWGTTSD